MALWFPIMVNRHEVGHVSLVRTDPLHRPVQDELCTYDVEYFRPEAIKAVIKTELTFPYQEANPIPILAAALNLISALLSNKRDAPPGFRYFDSDGLERDPDHPMWKEIP